MLLSLSGAAPDEGGAAVGTAGRPSAALRSTVIVPPATHSVAPLRAHCDLTCAVCPQCRLTAQLARAFHSGTGTARAFYTVAITMRPIRSAVPTGIAQAGAVPTRYSAESTVSCQLGWAVVSKRKRACRAVQFG